MCELYNHLESVDDCLFLYVDHKVGVGEAINRTHLIYYLARKGKKFHFPILLIYNLPRDGCLQMDYHYLVCFAFC